MSALSPDLQIKNETRSPIDDNTFHGRTVPAYMYDRDTIVHGILVEPI